MATNKKISDLTELSEGELSNDDVLPIVDVSAGTTHKVRKDTLAAALSGVSSISATSPIAVNQSTGSVTVSTGTIPVASGGTGATSLTDGGVLLGSGTGAVTAMAVLSDGQMIVGDGTTDPVAESGATLRTSIGCDAAGTDNSTNVTLAGSLDYLTISGQEITRNAVVLTTDVSGALPVANGGSGATSLTDGGVLLGSGTGAITATAVLADGEMIVGDGSTDPSIESGATLRTSIGLGTGDNAQFTNLTATGAFTSLGIDDNASETAITISADEEVTMTKQPAFLATKSSVSSNVTGDGTAYTVTFTNEVFDQNGDYNGSTTFTAPVAGRYRFTANVSIYGYTSANVTSGRLDIVTSNRTYRRTTEQPGGNDYTYHGDVLVDMDAADTATVQLTMGGDASDVVDVDGQSTGASTTYFCGELVA